MNLQPECATERKEHMDEWNRDQNCTVFIEIMIFSHLASDTHESYIRVDATYSWPDFFMYTIAVLCIKHAYFWVPVTDFIPSDEEHGVDLLLWSLFFLVPDVSLRLPLMNVLFEAPWEVLSNLFAKDTWPLFWRTVQKSSKCWLSFVSRILINISTISTLPFWSSIREYSTSVSNTGRSSGRKFLSKIPVLSSWWHSLNACFCCCPYFPLQ